MLHVIVEVWPHRDRKKKSTLSVIDIWRTGNHSERGTVYEYEVRHTEASCCGKSVQSGTVEHEHHGLLCLVGKVLTAVDPGGEPAV